MRKIRHLKALMWKNFILRYRCDRFLLLDLGIPLLLLPVYYFVLMNIATVVRKQHSYPPVNSSLLNSDNLKGVIINYMPKSTLADQLMGMLNDSGALVYGFNDVKDYLQKSQRSSLPLLVFKDLDGTIQMPGNLRFQMLDENYTLHLESLLDKSSEEIYESPAIAAVQKLVTELFIDYWSSQHQSQIPGSFKLDIAVQKMKHSGRVPPSQSLASLLSSILICATVPIIVNTISVIVSERHLHFQEYMQLHNVSETVYWLSWFPVVIISVFMVEMVFLFLLTMVDLTYDYRHIDKLVICLGYILHAINSTSFCFLMATFIVNEATRTYVVILVVPYILYVFTSGSMTWITQTLSIFLGVSVFQVAFCMSVKVVLDMGNTGRGYSFSNLTEIAEPRENISLFVCMLLIVANTVFNLCLTWYFSQLQTTYYSDPHSFLHYCKQNDSYQAETPQELLPSDKLIEPEPLKQIPAIQLHGIVKYSMDDVIVTETTMKIYSDKITVFLGPNGPDKSALIGMITGLMKPTYGMVVVCGYNLLINKEAAQEHIGLCPRYHVLFDRLTCLEHLQFFYSLKGIEVTESEVLELLVGIQLAEKALIKTGSLSSYEKRLLSLATATIGDPKVVILDEPSEGLSLAEQHALWSFLKTLKTNRTILVTSINVREADQIADWTAVIVDGDVKCYGSLQFLKHNYGVGYQLNILKKPKCHSEKVTAVVLHLIPTSYLQEENEKQLRYFLPHEDVNLFSKLLFNLETHTELLNIEILGIISTTMDEVFAKVRRGVNASVRSSIAEVDGYQTKRQKHRRKSSRKNKQREKEQQKKDEAKKEKKEQHRKEKKEQETIEEHKLEHDKKVENLQRKDKLKKEHEHKIEPHQKEQLKHKQLVNTNVNSSKKEQRTSGSETDLYPVTKKIHKSSSKSSIGSGSKTDMTKHSASSISLNSHTDDLPAEYLDTFISMEQHLTPSIPEGGDEYALKKYYTLSAQEISHVEKIKALFVKFIIITKERWVMRILQIGTPSLLLISGLLLDMQSVYNNQRLQKWYMLDDVPASRVNITITENTSQTLVDLYRNELPANHVPNVVLVDSRIEELKLAADNKELTQANSRFYIGADFSDVFYKNGVAQYNYQLHHGMAISLQFLLNANVRSELGHQFSVDSGLATAESLGDRPDIILCPTTTLGLSLGLVIFSLVTISALIRDRQSQRKQLLELYGVTPMLYWLSTFAWDMAIYTVLVVCIMVIFCLDKEVFLDDGRWLFMLLVLYLSAMAFFPEVYILQKLFTRGTSGILFIVILLVLTGVCGSFTLLFWDYTCSRPEYIHHYVYKLNTVLEIFNPLYSLTAAILPFPAVVTVLRSKAEFQDYFGTIKFNGVVIYLYRPLLVLLCQSVLFWIVLLVTDCDGFKQLCTLNYDTVSDSHKPITQTEDDDIVALKEDVTLAISNGGMFEAPLVVQNLRKCYGKLVAVEGTCLILQKGECFGLLGPTGSGKSTTLRMITGMEVITDGNVYVKGLNMEDFFPRVQKLISFTPQDSLLPRHLTGRETLLFFGRLRGIPEMYLNKEITALLNLLTLDLLDDSQVATYGASKQRLLSIAVGFLGQPELIILDEPSLGLDNAEQKALWAVMKKVTEQKTTVFFTSNSVEECETVCTRMAIQVAGRLKCLGSPKHLRTRFAMGYTINIYMNPDNYGASFTEKLVEHMVERFPGIRVSERYSELVSFHLPQVGDKLYEIFHNLKAVQKKFSLSNYFVHETTLEQVYLSFTLGQNVKPVKLVPKKKTVTWAEGTRDVVNTIPNKFSDYVPKRITDHKPSMSTEDLAKFFKSRFSFS